MFKRALHIRQHFYLAILRLWTIGVEEEEFVERLEKIPDGCAECFPFEMIERLRIEYLGG